MLFDPATVLLLCLALVPRRALPGLVRGCLRWRWLLFGLGFGLFVTLFFVYPSGLAIQLPFVLGNAGLFGLFAHAARRRPPPGRVFAAQALLAGLWTAQVFTLFPETFFEEPGTAHFWFLDFFDKAYLLTLAPLTRSLGAADATGFVLTYLREPVRFLSNSILPAHYLGSLLIAGLVYGVVQPVSADLPPLPRALARRVPLPFALVPALAFAATLAWPASIVALAIWKLAAGLYVARGVALLLVATTGRAGWRTLLWACLITCFLHPGLFWLVGLVTVTDGLLGLSEHLDRRAAAGLRFEAAVERLMAAVRGPAGRVAMVAVVVPMLTLPDLLTAPFFGRPPSTREESFALRSDDDPPRRPSRRLAARRNRTALVGDEIPRVAVAGRGGLDFLIDRFEHPNRLGAMPLTGLDPHQAEARCADAGGHLCTVDEWYEACSDGGRNFYVLPSQNYSTAVIRSVLEACNLAGMRRATRLMPSGAMPGCRGYLGVHDMVGNAYEWVRLPGGAGMWGLMGSYYRYEDDQTTSCWFRTLIHEAQLPITDRGAIGFRCCYDAPAE